MSKAQAGGVVEHVAHENFVGGAQRQDDDAPGEGMADGHAEAVDAEQKV